MDALVALSFERGYDEVRVGDIADRAHVSRATFYQLFRDKQDCFLQAHGALSNQILAEIHHALDRGSPHDALTVAAATLTELATRQPSHFDALTHQALLAGPSGRSARAALLDHIGTAARERVSRAGRPARWLVAPAILLGGLVRLAGIYRRGDATALIGSPAPALRTQLESWLALFAVSEPGKGAIVESARLRAAAERSPRALPRGRHRLPGEVVASIQRERIAFATAAAARDRDVKSLRVADIVATAGVSRDVFYEHCENKHHALRDAQRLILGSTTSAAAEAFFRSDSGWHERAAGATLAYASAFLTAPGFAEFTMGSAYAIDPTAGRRADEGVLAFGLLLERGRRERADVRLPGIACDAAAATVAETVLRASGTHRSGVPPPSAIYAAVAAFSNSEVVHKLVRQGIDQAAAER